MFKKANVPARIALTAYTGIAAFNIGFGARTTSSGFHIFPKRAWRAELKGEAAKLLESQWKSVELLIVDEISFIGQILFTRMHYCMTQGRRDYFARTKKIALDHAFGNASVVLVGDFGQLDPIEDFSLCSKEAPTTLNGKSLTHEQKKHAYIGRTLTNLFREAIVLRRIHRSGDDKDWTEACLRLRNLTEDLRPQLKADHARWKMHDLQTGHFSAEQKTYFHEKAVWLCALCKDVGRRNGKKLSDLARRTEQPVHRISAKHSASLTRSIRRARKRTSKEFGGLRTAIHLVKKCKVMITRNVSYLHGLANGTRGTVVGFVYSSDCPWDEFPEAIIVDVPDYNGPPFYESEPKWVPILPMTETRSNGESRTQFPLVAGFALTINKAQGLTLEEGVVVSLRSSSKSFVPASKHGLAFVAMTRSTCFAMTAFDKLPALHEFENVLNDPMLRKRQQFDEHLDDLHRQTMARHGPFQTAEEERQAHTNWIAPVRQKHATTKPCCPGCRLESTLD